MRVKGHLFTGVLRGQPLIELYFFRIVGTLGFEPFKGTLDVELDKSIDIRHFATKTLDHVLMDGRKKITAYFAPIDLIFNREGKEERYRCWAMKQVEGPYGDDVIEILAKDMLREKFGLAENSELEIELFELPHAHHKSFLEKVADHRPKRQTQLFKGR